MKGYAVALAELLLFFIGAHKARSYITDLELFQPVMYYWFCFTTLTGFWELIFLINYNKIASFAEILVTNKESVWTMDFPPYYILPNYLAKIFYAEYAANADREYKSKKRGDYWSRLIESSHAFCCGAFCCAALVATIYDPRQAFCFGMVGMGMQFMNSLLYMGEYLLQCRDKDNVNYNCPDFPLGKWMSDRWFMWVNIPWLLFPTIIIWQCC
jgi:hypothetical protein